MIALLKKDLNLNLSLLPYLIGTSFIFPLMIFILGPDYYNNLYPLMILGFSFILLTTPFKYDIRDKPHLLIQSLPVTRRQVVIGKYLSLIIYYMLSLVYSLILVNLLAILGLPFDPKISIQLIKETGFIFMLQSSVGLPAHMRLNPKLANIVNMFIYIGFINYIIARAGKDLGQTMESFINQNILLVLVMVILYLASMTLSLMLYKNRDLN